MYQHIVDNKIIIVFSVQIVSELNFIILKFVSILSIQKDVVAINMYGYSDTNWIVMIIESGVRANYFSIGYV